MFVDSLVSSGMPENFTDLTVGEELQSLTHEVVGNESDNYIMSSSFVEELSLITYTTFS